MSIKDEQKKVQLLHDAARIVQGWKGMTMAMDKFFLDLDGYLSEKDRNKLKRRKVWHR